MIRRLRTSLGRAVEALPEPVSLALRPTRYRYARALRPEPLAVPAGSTRLLIGRANFAAQGYRIARAAERLEGVGAVCLHVLTANAKYAFPADVRVPVPVFQHSAHWRRETFRIVAQSFTHVIIEAGRPLFGKLFDNDQEREIAALRAAGLTVGLAAYGSELRLPSRHRQIDDWSPFHDADWPSIPYLEAGAVRFRELATAVRAPVFVATPDQLEDWPEAVWLPVGIEPDRWRTEAPLLEHGRPIVVHAPTNAVIKGTHLVEPVLEALDREGIIEYRRIQGAPSDEMPSVIGSADIVLDQFRIGTYSVASVEGLAAGRLVVAHLHEQVRQAVRDRYNREIPIAAATPAELEALLRDVVARREHYRALAAEGPRFADDLHDGRAMAEALRPFLLGG